MGRASLTDPILGGEPNAIYVATGEFAVADHPHVLITPALGSCVGVAIWDAVNRRGGLAHIMLPTPGDTARDGTLERFASHAIPAMAKRLSVESATRRLVAKIAGGAAMFRGDSRLAGVGDRNVEEVKRQLTLLRIPLMAEDTGGSHARTMEFHLDTGLVVVRSYMYGIREL